MGSRAVEGVSIRRFRAMWLARLEIENWLEMSFAVFFYAVCRKLEVTRDYSSHVVR